MTSTRLAGGIPVECGAHLTGSAVHRPEMANWSIILVFEASFFFDL